MICAESRAPTCHCAIASAAWGAARARSSGGKSPQCRERLRVAAGRTQHCREVHDHRERFRRALQGFPQHVDGVGPVAVEVEKPPVGVSDRH